MAQFVTIICTNITLFAQIWRYLHKYHVHQIMCMFFGWAYHVVWEYFTFSAHWTKLQTLYVFVFAFVLKPTSNPGWHFKILREDVRTAFCQRKAHFSCCACCQISFRYVWDFSSLSFIWQLLAIFKSCQECLSELIGLFWNIPYFLRNATDIHIHQGRYQERDNTSGSALGSHSNWYKSQKQR